ncbi:DUF1254 domain-containing protein [soil metagenome]
MTLARRALLARALALPVVSPLSAPALVRAQETTPATLRDLARRATIHLFPVYEMYRLRWQATVDEANPQRQRLNRFRHVSQLADHRSRLVTTPNPDILYSSAWLDLSLEPMFLTVPPVGHLYYGYAFTDMFANTFASVSHRLEGGESPTHMPPTHMIVGPGWNGDASSEVTLVRAPTNSVWLLGRILVEGPEEIERVRILQARVLLETPDMHNERRILEARELMRQRTTAPPEPIADWPEPHPADPFDLFATSLRALGENPLSERHRALFETLAPLKLRPGRKFDLRAFSEAERRAILAGIEQGRAEIRAAGNGTAPSVDGWTYRERPSHRTDDDPLQRAHAALTGLAALEPEGSISMTCTADSNGRPLLGTNAYRIAFPADGLPPARAFWSLAMYQETPDGRAVLVDNPIGRYAIGERTQGLQKEADGSLTLYLQSQRPDSARAANWLPAPAGPLRLVLRAYEPGESLREGRYRPPGVQRNAP